MVKKDVHTGKYLEELKVNYGKRILELDSFSRHFSNTSSVFRSQYLSGMLDIIQNFIDVQKRFTEYMPTFYSDDFMISQSKIITLTWIQAIKNMDLTYSQIVEYAASYMKFYNKSLIEFMRSSEKFFEMSEKVPNIQRDTMIRIIKEAKKSNDLKAQKQHDFDNKDENQIMKNPS